MPPSSRQALSFQEKDALRNFKHQHPEATQQTCQAWFYENFDKKITQSTISEILAYKKPRRVRNPNRQRESSSKYPELDPVLYERAIALQTSGSKLSFPFLQQLAYDTWPLVYGNREVPKISLGMMQRFVTRNNLHIPLSRLSLDSQHHGSSKQQKESQPQHNQQNQQNQQRLMTETPQQYFIASAPTPTETICSQPLPLSNIYPSPLTPGYESNNDLPHQSVVKDQQMVIGPRGSYHYYITNQNPPTQPDNKQPQQYDFSHQQRIIPPPILTTTVTPRIPSLSNSPLTNHTNYGSLTHHQHQQLTHQQLPLNPAPHQMHQDNPPLQSLPQPLPQSLPQPLPQSLPQPLPQSLSQPLPQHLPQHLPQPIPYTINKNIGPTESNPNSISGSVSSNLSIHNSSYYNQAERSTMHDHYSHNRSNSLKPNNPTELSNNSEDSTQWGN